VVVNVSFKIDRPAEFNIASEGGIDIGARVVMLRIRTGAEGNQFFVGSDA
jgi:hypothetical protein